MSPAAYAHQVLAPHPASVPAARRLVRDVLTGQVAAETVEDAQTVVSELVTNAVVHAGTAVEVEVRVEDSGAVYLAVTDGASEHPLRARSGAERSTGRGLALVSSLTREWGVAIHRDRKALWCHLGGPHHSAQHRPADTTGAETMPSRPGFAVTLVNVPVDVYRSWIEDAEALLRDHLLSGLEETSVEDPLRRHAECSQALALLVEAFADITAAGTGSGTATGEGEVRIVLWVSARSVGDFQTLNEVLDAAVKLAASGEYLAAVTSPTAQNFRRWLCREVLVQSTGAPPTPWDPTVEN
jgi:anti-sigma regulatory factor (Ser/Thr protein kinase)